MTNLQSHTYLTNKLQGLKGYKSSINSKQNNRKKAEHTAHKKKLGEIKTRMVDDPAMFASNWGISTCTSVISHLWYMDKTFNRNVHHNIVPKDQEFCCNDQMLQLVRVKKFLRWNGNSKMFFFAVPTKITGNPVPFIKPRPLTLLLSPMVLIFKIAGVAGAWK